MKMTDYKGVVTAVFVVVLLLGLCALIAAAIWFAVPREQPISLGSVSDLDQHEPNYVPVSSELAVFLSRSDEDVLAWSALSPRTSCRIRCAELNNRS